MQRCSLMISRITYKPGWVFRLQGNSLFVRAKVLDSWPPHGETEVEFETAVAPEYSEDLFFRQALRLVQRAETHEMREWFKVDGIRWPDLHHSLL